MEFAELSKISSANRHHSQPPLEDFSNKACYPTVYYLSHYLRTPDRRTGNNLLLLSRATTKVPRKRSHLKIRAQKSGGMRIAPVERAPPEVAIDLKMAADAALTFAASASLSSQSARSN